MAEFVKVETKVTITFERWELDLITEALREREQLYNAHGTALMPAIVVAASLAEEIVSLRENLEEFAERPI